MKKKKEDQFEKKIKDAVEVAKGLCVRDYYGATMSRDMFKGHVEPLRDFIDVKTGDYVFIVSFKWKSLALKKEAQAEIKRVLDKYRRRAKRLAERYIKNINERK